jgi:glycosyltransferase involved in cell wall biosynthesis
MLKAANTLIGLMNITTMNNAKKPKVLVLLASFNGEKFIEQQIDSIFKQQDVDVYLAISDDRSTDSTIIIVNRLKEKYKRIEVSINEKNKGFTYNFLDLIFKYKDSDFDYYALSDQDDYWLPNKLISAIRKFGNTDSALYFSKLIDVDEKLNKIKTKSGKAFNIEKQEAIFKNCCTGCTAVFNLSFLRKVTEYYPNNIYLHDYWLYLIAVFLAKVLPDENGYILYRQHSNNQIGSKSDFFSKVKKQKNHQAHLCEELLNGYSKYLNKEDIKLLQAMADYSKKKNGKIRLINNLKKCGVTERIVRLSKIILKKY